MITLVLGGVGLFLLGMLLMTEGLKAIAGSALNKVLANFTRTPFVGMLSGATMTALVQSSSVTTLAMIGFVSAGLLTFQQSLGLILGMNLGTTSTAWIVSLIGFKVNVAALALPMVALGTFIKLLGNGKITHHGTALAGFGLIFIGIATLQEGMADLATRYDPSSLPGMSFWGILLLFLVGVSMTIVMQSSSAAVATTLTALYGSAINIEQAAVLVIGQNVGTTAKAAIAALGASVAAKRVSVAHILFNVMTALVALLLLPWLISGMVYLRDVHLWTESATLAAFHTSFNVIGVVLIFPFLKPFTSLITGLLPEVGPSLTLHLNPRIINVTSAAIEAARKSTLEIARVLVDVAQGQLSGRVKQKATLENLSAAKLALAETRRYLGSVRAEQGGDINQQQHVSVFHAIDHLSQLSDALEEFEVAENVPNSESCQSVCTDLANVFAQVPDMILAGEIHAAAEMMEAKSLSVADQRRDQRRTILERTATLGLDPDSALDELEAMRWADRLAYHIWRVTHHLREDQTGDGLNTGEKVGKKVKVKDKNKKKKKKDKKEKKEKGLSEEGMVQPYTPRGKH
jgi:phosphate:Na+ symporter